MMEEGVAGASHESGCLHQGSGGQDKGIRNRQESVSCSGVPRGWPGCV